MEIFVRQIFEELIKRHPQLTACEESISRAFLLLEETFAAGNKLLLCGNGGSASDCEHIVGELMKSFLLPRPISASDCERLERLDEIGGLVARHLHGGLPCISLTGHPALCLAIANDIRADMVFAQQAWALGRPGDLLLGISTSGNSANVFHAALAARTRGMKVLALTGQSGGRLAPASDVAIRAPAETVVEIQELHLAIYHALCAALELSFFADVA